MLEKNKIHFPKQIDFNYLADFIGEGNFVSKITCPYQENFVMHSITQIRDIQYHNDFKELYKFCNDNYNLNNKPSNLMFFYSMKLGSPSVSHFDDEDVYIIGVYGKTFYKVGKDEYIVEPGDLLKIPANTVHTAIGLTPRIIISYGVFNE